jgi:ClpP class serine protease
VTSTHDTNASTRRVGRVGEPLAIDPRALKYEREVGREAFFWLFGPPVKETERVGEVAVVHVRGPLEHHSDGYSDSYDSILCRVRDAFSGVDVSKAYERRNYWRQDYEPLEPCPAAAVVLCLDSPGGVVAGLNDTVRSLRQASKAAKRPLVAFVNEMATSAAYALACSCSEIVVPASGILGSIGVISTMVDVTAADKADGLRFVTITSGERKADGHPHVPISDAAIKAETARVEKLADQFYRLVRTSRGLSLDTIQRFQAGIFLGQQAARAGLADSVMSYDEFMATLCDKVETAPDRTRDTKPLAQSGATGSHSTQSRVAEKIMPLSLDALIRRTEASIAAEKDPKKLGALVASLEAYKKTKHSIEKHETEEGEEEDEEEEEGGNETDRTDDPDKDKDDDDDEEEDEKSAAAPPQKKSAKSKSKKGEDSKKGEEEAESEEDEAEALLHLVRRATGKSGAAARGALEGLLSTAREAKQLASRLDALEHQRKAEARDAVVDRALAANRVTKKEAASLKKRPMAHVEAFLEARPRGLVYSQSEDLPVPQMQNADGTSVLPPDLEKQLAAAITASEGKVTREQILGEYAKMNARRDMNGRGP